MKTKTIVYQAGTQIAEVERRFGVQRIIKLASNENPLGPSPRAIEGIGCALNSSNRYPDASSEQLREVISAKLRIHVGRLMISNGTTHLIDTIMHALCEADDEVLLFERTFVYYRISAQNHNITFKEAKRGPNFSYQIENLMKEMTPKTKLIFVAAPDNPTGVYITRAEIEQLLAAMPARALLVFDEAYREYVPAEAYFDPTSIHDPRLLILRTFSKIYGLAGFRCGYAVGDASLIGALSETQAPFSVNVLAQTAAAAAILDEEHLLRSQKMNDAERAKMERLLTQSNIPYIKSYSNFVMLNTRPLTGDFLYQQLLSRGVIIRPLDAYGLGDYVRVTFGLPEENQVFLQQMLRLYRS